MSTERDMGRVQNIKWTTSLLISAWLLVLANNPAFSYSATIIPAVHLDDPGESLSNRQQPHGVPLAPQSSESQPSANTPFVQSGDFFKRILHDRKVLDLTSQQTDTITRMWFEHQKLRIQLEADRQIARLDLDSVLYSDTVNKERVSSLVERLNDIEGRITRAEVEARFRVLELLTPEQKSQVRTWLSAP